MTNQNTIANAADLSARFLKVSLTTTFPGSGKKLDDVAAQVESANNAEIGKAVRVQKALYDKDFLKAVSTARNACTVKHRALTSTWDESHWRLLPTTKWIDYSGEMNPLISAFEKAADDAASLFDYELMNSRSRLGNLFCREDYPGDSGEFRQKFTIKVDQEPLPQATDASRIMLPATEIARIQKSMESALQSNISRVMAEGFDRIFSVAKNLRDSIDRYARGEQKSVHKTLIEQVMAACDYCAQFNLAGDSHMTSLIEDMRNSLTRYEMDEIREDPAKQSEVIIAAASIADKAAARRAKSADMAAAFGSMH